MSDENDEKRYSLYGDWWKPQIREEHEDRIIEVMNIGEESACTHMRIYFLDLKLDVLYSAKGCIEVCKFMNDSTPESFTDDDFRQLHVCDMAAHIEALQQAEVVAEEHWRPI